MHLQRRLCQRTSSGTGGTLDVDQFIFNPNYILLKQMLLVSTWYMRIFPLALCSLNEYNFRKILQRLELRCTVDGASFNVEYLLGARSWSEVAPSKIILGFLADSWHISNLSSLSIVV